MSTLKDVARKAQVSPITVSRVINTPEKVKAETCERVRRVMSSLQYIPNVAAKNLVAKRSGIIDVFVPESIDLSNPLSLESAMYSAGGCTPFSFSAIVHGNIFAMDIL